MPSAELLMMLIVNVGFSILSCIWSSIGCNSVDLKDWLCNYAL